MLPARVHLVLLGLLSSPGLNLVSAGILKPGIARRGVTCYFDIQAEAGETCDDMSASWGISVEEFTKLNPGVTCPDLQAGKSYCVVGEYTDDGGQTTLPPSPTTMSAPSTTPPTTPPTTIRTSTITSTTTAPDPGNSPAMPGIVANCDRFYKVQSGDGCDSIAQKNGITSAQFKSWNKEINASCSNLWLDYYVCVHVPGATTPPTTTTGPSPSNSPLMPGVVGNCNRFYKVHSGDSCDSIAQKSGITPTQLKSWNAEINASCSNLWLDYYICIGVPGAVTTTSPPAPSNSPALPGIVSSCNKWYKIQSGDSCDNVAAKNTITVAQLRSFNTQLNSSM